MSKINEITFSVLENGVEIKTEDKTILFPLQRLSAIAHQGDNQTVDLRLMGSRKNILSFRYDKCNMALGDAEETAKNIQHILNGEEAK